MKTSLDLVIEKLMEAGMNEIEACTLVSELLEEEAEDYLALKNSDFEISDEDIENLRKLLDLSSTKLS